LGRTTDQRSEIFLRIARQFFQGTYQLVFVHWSFQEVKSTGYGSPSDLSVRQNNMAPYFGHPGQERIFG
jgi:hypothetical protein